MERLEHLAHIVRSKNAGPFFFTFDILFDIEENYRRVKQSGVITTEAISKLYRIPVRQVQLYFYDNAYGIKITFPRPVSSGDFGDTDGYGAQQHAPLLGILIP